MVHQHKHTQAQPTGTDGDPVGEPPPPRHHRSHSDSNNTLRDTQLKLGESEEQRRADALQAELDGLKKKWRRYKTTSTDDDVAIATFGRRFACMYEPWILGENITTAPRSKKPLMVLSWERYNSPHTKSEAIRQETCLIAPKRLHLLMLGSGSDHFVAMCCSTTTKHIRDLAPIIFDLQPALFKTGADQSQAPTVLKLLKFDTTKLGYPSMPPLLYPNRTKNNMEVFQSRILLKVGQCLLRGPGSLKVGDNGHGLSTNTFAKLWHVHQVTPGFIAFCAILVSDIREFVPLGNSTGVHYDQEFEKYKKFLVQNGTKDHVVQLYKVYNGFIFPDVQDAGQGEGEGDGSDFDEAMREMGEDESVEGEPHDDDDDDEGGDVDESGDNEEDQGGGASGNEGDD
ncbi:hypothetical protein JAAARDRAFT_194325 [Jaapia argillacea MUCL 33604]|uniref:Uncharacterized protein n=1 Tax=Jaapia argillacea MUCL 33604 TaxID=933084 RepID=A0A067PTH1_9AGAM|nr:hypothetical protein JAAARDRAFT_194325 [Jaapia argillacea MUCL 33604]